MLRMQSYTVHTCTRMYIVRSCTYVYNTSGPWNLMLSGHANYQFCVTIYDRSCHAYQHTNHMSLTMTIPIVTSYRFQLPIQECAPTTIYIFGLSGTREPSNLNFSESVDDANQHPTSIHSRVGSISCRRTQSQPALRGGRYWRGIILSTNFGRKSTHGNNDRSCGNQPTSGSIPFCRQFYPRQQPKFRQ